MPPLTPSSSQEIVCISLPSSPEIQCTGSKPGRGASEAGPSNPKRRREDDDEEAPPSQAQAVKSNAITPSAVAKPKIPKVSSSQSRARVTERMLSSLSSTTNPITHSNAFERTDHVHSCSTGHQQRGGDRGFWASARDMGLKPDAGPEHTYWSVRTSNVEAAAREKVTNILSGCVIAINGPTGPKVSNLQLQNLITANGGRYVPHQSSRCTHVIAARLSGSKSQKYINGQGSRGAALRTQVVKVEWVLDCVAQGKRINEAGYLVVEDPTQHNLFTAFAKQPKLDLGSASSSKSESTPSASAPSSSK